MSATLDKLVALRPVLDEAPVASWDGEAALRAVLDEAPLSYAPATTCRPHPWAVRIGVAASVAAAALVATAALPPLVDQRVPGMTTAEAAVLHRLAARAEAAPTDELLAGQYRYFKSRTVGTAETKEGQVTSEGVSEEWVSADGSTWGRDTLADGSVETYRFQPSSGRGQGNYGRSYLDSLPTEARALYQELCDTVQGSSSKDEAVFVAVGDILRTRLAGPDLRAAAINSLSLLPVDVTPNVRSAGGRMGVLVSMTRPHDDGTEAMLIDEPTSEVIEERHTNSYDRPVENLTARALAATTTLLLSRVDIALPSELRGL